MCKVVLVDDDASFLEMISEILEEEGHEVEAFPAVNFLQHYEQVSPDVLIIDVWFGEETDGLQLSKALANHRKLHKIPLILMSSDERLGQFAQQVKADSYLQKPFNIPEMLIKISQVTS